MTKKSWQKNSNFIKNTFCKFVIKSPKTTVKNRLPLMYLYMYCSVFNNAEYCCYVPLYRPPWGTF